MVEFPNPIVFIMIDLFLFQQIEHDLSKLSNENKTLRQQNGLTTTAHDKLKVSLTGLKMVYTKVATKFLTIIWN